MPIAAISWENQRSSWKMNITKMREMLKSEKFMIIFTKTWAEKGKFIINFSDLSVFPTFVIFIFKLDANFPGLRPKSAYFFDFIHFFVSVILSLSWEFGKENRKKKILITLLWASRNVGAQRKTVTLVCKFLFQIRILDVQFLQFF